jgi:hypothetical protein
VNLFREMLGDYGWHTPTETLLVKQYDNNIPADLHGRGREFHKAKSGGQQCTIETRKEKEEKPNAIL